MVRTTVRKVGMIKKRQAAKYAIDVQQESDITVTLGVLAIFANEADDESKDFIASLLSCFLMQSDLNPSKEVLNLSLNQL